MEKNNGYTYAAPLKALGKLPSRCKAKVFVLLPAWRSNAIWANAACVGHPQNLEALRASGADVKVLRASCNCQAKRLHEEGSVHELTESGRTLSFTGSARSLSDTALALSHLRAWHEAIEVTVVPVLVLMAEANIQSGYRMGLPISWASQMLATTTAATGRGDALLWLGDPPDRKMLVGGTGSGYMLSPNFLQRLKLFLPTLKVQPSDQLLACLHRLATDQVQRPIACAQMVTGSNTQQLSAPCPTMSLHPARKHSAIKVVVITLAHRGDRRIDPLVAGPSALAAMQKSGFDVEVLRASCYCERDAVEQYGRLPCYFDDKHWANFQRYDGATKALDSEEEEELLEYLNENYEHGAERLADPDDGDLAGYLRDTNWPGATSCAMSHMRGLIRAALHGNEFALVFEDDAVIPTSVAKKRGWCESCTGQLCFCPDAWVFCVEEAVELMKRAPQLDLLYLGVGEAFEPPGPHQGILAESDSDDELGGVTEMGYTWCAEAILYARSALEDVLALKLHERIWAQDETVPHLYSQKPWNPRFMESLKKVGFKRRWLAGAPADDVEEGWIQQLEFFKEELDNAHLALAWRSSNSSEL